LGFQATVLLIAEAVALSAIGAIPGDMVAGHPPDVFMHAALADGEAAATTPTEGEEAAAAVTLLLLGATAATGTLLMFYIIHDHASKTFSAAGAERLVVSGKPC
jgi:hypothetical protein